jgi:hypothetical protein
MKTKTALIVLPFLLATATGLHGWDAKDLVGDYELQGVMEMAGGLTLKPDQKYAAGFSYGAADWIEEGSWRPEGDGVVLSGSHFKIKNAANLPLFLPSGTHFAYQDGRLTASGPGGKVTFINPNKTPSHRKETGQAGEGRMLVHGKVLKLDSEEMVVKVKECMMFSVPQLSPEVLKAAKVGQVLDAEIPYSAIIGGGSCP